MYTSLVFQFLEKPGKIPKLINLGKISYCDKRSEVAKWQVDEALFEIYTDNIVFK